MSSQVWGGNMRFVLVDGMMQAANQMGPTTGAIVPTAMEQMFDHWMNHILITGAHWFVQSGIPICIEGLLIWGMICLLIAITGSGKWLERGVKSILFSVLLGAVRISAF